LIQNYFLKNNFFENPDKIISQLFFRKKEPLLKKFKNIEIDDSIIFLRKTA
jgi:hypothetical protein